MGWNQSAQWDAIEQDWMKWNYGINEWDIWISNICPRQLRKSSSPIAKIGEDRKDSMWIVSDGKAT
jgi:hypothetical protein